MKLLLLLDCKHTSLILDHKGPVPNADWCVRCREVKPVVDSVSNQEQYGPDGKH